MIEINGRKGISSSVFFIIIFRYISSSWILTCYNIFLLKRLSFYDTVASLDLKITELKDRLVLVIHMLCTYGYDICDINTWTGYMMGILEFEENRNFTTSTLSKSKHKIIRKIKRPCRRPERPETEGDPLRWHYNSGGNLVWEQFHFPRFHFFSS